MSQIKSYQQSAPLPYLAQLVVIENSNCSWSAVCNYQNFCFYIESDSGQLNVQIVAVYEFQSQVLMRCFGSIADPAKAQRKNQGFSL